MTPLRLSPLLPPCAAALAGGLCAAVIWWSFRGVGEVSETEYEAALVEARKRLRNYRGGFVSRLLDSMTPEQREQWFAKMAQLEGECGNILCGDPREFSRDKRP